MPTTDTPTLPLESYPARTPRVPRERVEPDGALRIVRRVLLLVVSAVVVLGALARVGVQVLGVWSPAPDTSALDDLVRDAGLHESARTEQSGSPAFGHPASVSLTVDGALGTRATCAPLYRAAAADGWSSSAGIDAASCAAPLTEGFPTRNDVLTGPEGERVSLSWDPNGGTVWMDVEERLDGV